MLQLSGSLTVGALLHVLIGLTGLVSFIMRFVGPVTIVPSIVLIGLFVYKVAVRFAESHWGVAALSVYLVFLFIKERFLYNLYCTPVSIAIFLSLMETYCVCLFQDVLHRHRAVPVPEKAPDPSPRVE